MTTYEAYSGIGNHGTWNDEKFRSESENSLRQKGNATGYKKIRSRFHVWKWGLIGAFCVLGAVMYLHGTAAAQSTAIAYRVHSGDTLWSIARKSNPGKDPRRVVTEILNLNHLSGTQSIYPGEVLNIPRK